MFRSIVFSNSRNDLLSQTIYISVLFCYRERDSEKAFSLEDSFFWLLLNLEFYSNFLSTFPVFRSSTTSVSAMIFFFLENLLFKSLLSSIVYRDRHRSHSFCKRLMLASPAFQTRQEEEPNFPYFLTFIYKRRITRKGKYHIHVTETNLMCDDELLFRLNDYW